MSIQSCMGGWCAKRAKCPHYHAEDRREPEERLCWPGMDGEVLDVVRFVPVERDRQTAMQGVAEHA